MTQLVLKRLESLDALRAEAAAWDSLWMRSEIAMPTARAELLAQWVEQFEPGTRWTAVVVRDGERFVAAIPLLTRKVGRVLSFGGLPGNDWCPAGDLLLDPQTDVERVLDLLVVELGRLGWPLYWFDAVDWESPRWQAFRSACARAGWSVAGRERFRVNQVEIDHDWPAYQESWSGNHRRHMRKASNRAEREGHAELEVFSRLAPGEIEPLLRRGFEVEDRSWKGSAGSSVLRAPGIFEFFLRQARQLAAWGQLELVFLNFNGQPIAFEYVWNCKGVAYTPKVGYDEAFARLSPSQLLRYFLLQQFYADPHRRLVDYMGPATDVTNKWATRSYPCCRVVAAPRGWYGGLLFFGYERAWPALNKLRQKWCAGRPQPSSGDEPQSSIEPLQPEPVPV